MTNLQKKSPINTAKTTTSRFSYVLDALNDEPRRDWKNGRLAGAVVFCAAFAFTWTVFAVCSDAIDGIRDDFGKAVLGAME